MALPTCDVVCAMHDQAGAPIPGAVFEITLNRFEVYEGFVVPAKTIATSGADGTVTVALWPNQLGSTESGYNVTMRAPNGKTQRIIATIPNVATVNLHDVSTVPPYPGKPDAQVYIEMAQGIVDDANSAAASAANSAASAATSASASEASALAASTSAAAASGSATAAAGSATAASGSATAASGSATAAAGSATAASGSATAASGSASAASASAAAAQATADALATMTIGGHRNTLLNGNGSVNQRATTPIADDTYGLDRWIALTESGTVNMTGADPGPGEGTDSSIRMWHSDGSPKRFGFAQIIEAKNIQAFRSKPMTLSGRLRLEVAGNIRYAVLEKTGPGTDTVTSDIVNNWASTNYTAGNFFIGGAYNVISTGVVAPGAATWGDLLDTASPSSGMTNVIVFVWTESPVAADVFLQANRLQYEPGSVKTSFEHRHDELELCQRYYWRGLPCGGLNFFATAAGQQMSWPCAFPVKLRAAINLASSFSATTFSNCSTLSVNLATAHGFRILAVSTAANSNCNFVFGVGDYIAADSEL